jgi:outer membrane protein assembly factor BamB
MQRRLAWAGGLALGIGLLVLPAPPAAAVIERLLPLKDILAGCPFIFTVTVDALDPDKPAVVLVVEDHLKGKAPFAKLPVNLKGDSEAEKEKQTAQLLKRLAPKLPLIVFVIEREKRYQTLAYSNGTWFEMIGHKTDDGVRWGFTHVEPYLRRTFKGTTAELKQVIADTLAGKKEPPDVDKKEKPGLGPEVQAEEKQDKETRRQGDKETSDSPCLLISLSPCLLVSLSPCLLVSLSLLDPTFAVIPTVLVGGPLAFLAMLFPAVFGGLMLVLRRWTAALSVVSLNSTLFLLHDWLHGHIKDTWWGTPLALWLTMTLVTWAGALWAWWRHLRAVAARPADASIEAPPARRRTSVADRPSSWEAVALTVLSAVCLGLVGWCVLKGWSLTGPDWRPFLVLWVGVWASTLYTLGLRWAARDGAPGRGTLPNEGVMLLAMLFAATSLVAALPQEGGAAFQVADSPSQPGERAVKPKGVAWKFEAVDRGTIASSPLVVGDRVYVAGAHGSAFAVYGTVYCLDRTTGKAVWSFNDDENMKQVFSSPCLADGKLYIGEGFHQDRKCKLYCLKADSGIKLWEFQTESHTESSPCVVNGRVWFGAGDDGLYCLDAETGKPIWHFEGLHVDANPFVANGRVWCGSGVGDVFSETAIFCLDAYTGKELWRMPTELPAWGSPVVDGDHVFVGLGNGNLLESAAKPAGSLWCLDARTGRRLWTYDVPDGVLVRPVVDEQRVYFGSRDGHCYAVDRCDGRRLWQQDLGSPVVASPVLSGWPGDDGSRSLYAVGAEGRVSCLDPKSGRVLWKFDVAKQAQAGVQLFGSPAVVTTRVAEGYRRQVCVGAGLINSIGSRAAVVYCLEDVMEER